jgi:hypothetical protein
MATKTATRLTERITTLEERLRELKTRQDRIEARKAALLARRARKDDTRRKILLGGLVLEKLEAGDLDTRTFRRWLDKALDRDSDRALFDLAPRPPADPKPSSAKR